MHSEFYVYRNVGDGNLRDIGALLASIRSLQEAIDLRSLVATASAAIPHLTGASAGAVYIEGARGDPAFAVRGPLPETNGETLKASLKELAAAAKPGVAPLAGEPGTLAASFHSDFQRGAILAACSGLIFGEEDARMFEELARQVCVRANSLATLQSFRLLERIEGAVVGAVSAGILVVVDGKINLINIDGAELLGVKPEDALGRSLHWLWPDLAEVMNEGRSLGQQSMRRQGKMLSVTLRPISGGLRAGCAAVTFVEDAAPPAAKRPRLREASLTRLDGVVGVSDAVSLVRELAALAAQSASGVLIEGESGVGKEVLAQAIHAMGPRHKQPFVAVLCAAIPRELLESELFGYEPGAFTGASPRGRAGKFETAQGGTLLLDDIMDMPIDMQAKLLRVLQERVVTRVGANRPHPIDVRVIATSHPLLSEAVKKGLFRADLYYRLHVLSITIPPLRDRPEDIKPLAEHFLGKHAPAHHSNLRTVGVEALRQLESYPWPGNIRELEHWMESEIHFARAEDTCLRRLSRIPDAIPLTDSSPVRPLSEVERDLYSAAFAGAAGDVSRAARNLGVSRGKLYRKLRLYGSLPKRA